ncbi:MAG: UDP-N-acetylmuramoyl-tripeptide--D-alanyl-D-alanine ligase [Candidatus Eremiobacteraeota bacterium]|nr:UDP-N-acetylmuramoyl-tripeptide--D-alanyl-D-alanine ligase [Candidatus Eremiobacteraeota bacterium]
MRFATALKAMQVLEADVDALPAQLDVSTDSRAVAPGQTYLALRGEQFDGHEFIADAVAKGASAVIAQRRDAIPSGVPACIVSDTTRAYLEIASAARDAFRGSVVAITGSTGKTTTKEFLAQLLAPDVRVAASPANENNEIGVSKLLLSAPRDTGVLIVEMGARHPGDIQTLVDAAKPNVAILTNIGEAHLEIFGSRGALADTKWAIFNRGARAVLNARDEISRERARSLGRPARWFGRGIGDVPAGARGAFVVDRTHFHVVDAKSATYETHVGVPGDYNVENVAAAAAGALEVGIDGAALAQRFGSLLLPTGRYEEIRLSNGPRLIYDAYNASMSGTIATLDAFAHEPGRRRIAVLGSMAELGVEAPEMHERVGACAAHARLDALLVGGRFADDLARGARDAGFDSGAIVRFDTNESAVAWLRDNARRDDVVLLKGSRVYKLEEIVEGLRA